MKGIFALLALVLAQSTQTEAFVAPSSVSRVQTARSVPDFVVKPTFDTTLLAEAQGEEEKSKLPFWLDIGTKGGAVFLSFVLFLIPIGVYNLILAVSDVDELDLGRWIGVGFTAVATVAWLGTYLFRVVTKDMTYVSGGWATKAWHRVHCHFRKRMLSLHFLTLLDIQAKQLKDYENAVIAKRLEELDEDELQALVEEVDKDDF